MTHHGSPTVGQHEDRECRDAMAAFLEAFGAERATQRVAEIQALPWKLWRGKRVYQIRCEGPFGNGPHDMWVPESLLWSLLDLGHFCCAFHR